MVRIKGFGEQRLVNDWLLKFHPTKPQWKRVRVGPFPDGETAREFSVVRRWADAIVLDENRILIVEAKINPSPTAFGQLELYELLFRETPEFSQYRTLPITKIFLTTGLDAALLELATKKDIQYEIFDPFTPSNPTGEASATPKSEIP